MTTIAPGPILLADDDSIYRIRLAQAFTRRGFTVLEAHDGRSALEIIATHDLAYAVLDLRMPSPGGLELVSALAQQRPNVISVVLTGYGSIPTAIDAIRLGATDYLQKPADLPDVLRALGRQRGDLSHDPPRATDTPSLARAEWEHLQRVLGDCGGNISAAARVLRIARRTLQRKLSKYPAPK